MGGPKNKDDSILGSSWGTPILGNYLVLRVYSVDIYPSDIHLRLSARDLEEDVYYKILFIYKNYDVKYSTVL